MLHPLKNLPNFVTSSVNHQSASVFGTKDIGIVMNMYKYDVINVDAGGEKHGVTRWTSKKTVVAK